MDTTYVVDASTLILLAKVTNLKDFAQQYNLIIPASVKKESLFKKEAEDAQIITVLLEKRLLKESDEKLVVTSIMKNFGMGVGEAESLQLALQHKYRVATDDWRAIKACKILNLQFITAIHCLILLYQQKIFSREIALEKLKKLEKYGRYRTEIIANAEKRIRGENHE
ncbi:hypothetical protein HZB01_04510 [Candidatus Woesearchaeota archaeon]|nr:hypothetical protein [Candidatus Woesearchaeota archaeon]